ncbi:MAG: hypothetical protein B6244_12920 [Candidatus Cloacimonetes bacterium 4572_55]|nr:MAG: hypothetical protein B6244_12920 [Candidatus Cloacimonetes bacterium 4572_55]
MHSIVDLSGCWKIKPVDQFVKEHRSATFDDSDWEEQDVPGQWQCQTNFKNYQGKMVYRKSFTFTRHADKTNFYEINFTGIFYFAIIYLNGRRLGHYEGYFSPISFFVTKTLQENNLLVVEVNCPPAPPDHIENLILGIFRHTRYFPKTFNPGGIWGRVYISSINRYAIRHLRFKTTTIDDQQATVEVKLVVDSTNTEEATVQYSLKPANFAGTIYQWRERSKINRGRTILTGKQALSDIELWWTYDLGFPSAYNLTVQLIWQSEVRSEYTALVGIRMIQLENRRVYLNGKSLFLRGANYLPTHPYISQVNPDTCLTDVKLAIDSHINCLRVRSHVAYSELYQACDLQGMLVWQDFPLFGMYPREILPVAKRQLSTMVDMLGSHPCIGVICCHDEPFPKYGRSKNLREKARKFIGRYVGNWNQNRLDVFLRKSLKKEDSGHIVIQSSGLWGMLGSLSDVHFHWYHIDKLITRFSLLSYFLGFNNRIVSDFGSFSSPVLETLVEHQGEPDKEGMIDLHISQNRQAEILKFFIEKLRLMKYKPIIGIFFSDLHDMFMTGGTGIVDARRCSKPAHKVVKDALRPRCLIASEITDKKYHLGDVLLIPVHLINDCQEESDTGGEINIKIKLGRRLFLETTLMVKLVSDSRPVQMDVVFFRPQEPGTHHLRLSMRTEKEKQFQTDHTEIVTQYELPII